MNLNRLLLSSVSKFPNNKLFLQGKDNINYIQFYETIHKYRSFMVKKDIIKGDRIVILGNNSSTWAAIYYAALSLGVVCVPIYKNQHANVKKHIFNEVEPKYIFDVCHSYQLAKCSDELKEDEISSDDPAIILYTSGTTGLAKGIELTHNNIISNLNAINDLLPKDTITENDKYVSFLPWSHCYGLTCELNFLISKGASVGINTDVKNLMNDFHVYNPTILCAVPKLFQTIYSKIHYLPIDIIKHSPFMKNKIKSSIFGKSFRFATVGGASISKDLLEFYDKLNIELYQGYGMTETSPMVSLNVPGKNRIGSVGSILNCNKVEIDPTNSEICIEGNNVMKNVDKYRTGDMGEIIDGYLYITGRIKEQYKLSNGKFVNPAYIEDILLQIPAIKQIMVCDHNEEYNIALVVSDKNEDYIMKEILLISHKLKKYEIPQKIIIIKDLFTVENGMLSAKFSLKRDVIKKRYLERKL